jgi:hypothetical protein
MKLICAKWHYVQVFGIIPKFTNIGLQTWKVQMETSLCPRVKYGFHFASFHRVHSQQIDFIDHILYQILFKLDKNVENMGKMYFPLEVKYGLHCIDFNEMLSCWTVLYGDFQHCIALMLF